MANAEPTRISFRPGQKAPVSEKPSPEQERVNAMRELKDAEASALAADTWLKQVAQRVATGELTQEHSDYLRSLLGSEKFEEGSVQFLAQVAQNLEQALTLVEPGRREAAELRLATARKHLEALGKRLAGLRLLLNGPKPVQPTPPQA